MKSVCLLVGVLFAFCAVLFGAFASHALKGRLTQEFLDIFEIGVRYQMYHALALLLLGVVASSSSNVWLKLSGGSFVLGTLLFSGSLYILALSGVRAWGAVTPVGGVFFLLGWLLFGCGIWR